MNLFARKKGFLFFAYHIEDQNIFIKKRRVFLSLLQTDINWTSELKSPRVALS